MTCFAANLNRISSADFHTPEQTIVLHESQQAEHGQALGVVMPRRPNPRLVRTPFMRTETPILVVWHGRYGERGWIEFLLSHLQIITRKLMKNREGPTASSFTPFRQAIPAFPRTPQCSNASGRISPWGKKSASFT